MYHNLLELRGFSMNMALVLLIPVLRELYEEPEIKIRERDGNAFGDSYNCFRAFNRLDKYSAKSGSTCHIQGRLKRHVNPGQKRFR
jgi:hypothetical protein